MNQNVINNTAYNYLSYYGISMKHLNEIKKLVVESTNTKFYLYKRLCELAPNIGSLRKDFGLSLKLMQRKTES